MHAAHHRPVPALGIDLQVSVLRNLPTPILVLGTERTLVFANRAAERALDENGAGKDSRESATPRILGQKPAKLGLRLLYNRTWDVVLDKLVSAQTLVRSEGGGAQTRTENLVHEVEVALEAPHFRPEDRHFRVLISVLGADDGMHFMLSFERSAHFEKRLIPREGQEVRSIDGAHSAPPIIDTRRDSVIEAPRDISRIKKAVFDSSNVVAFILSADENFYLANKKTREILGDIVGGAEGCDGLSLRASLEIWDEHFTRRLDRDELPGMKLVRAKKALTDYRCGFVHAITRNKTVMTVNGECLYDDDTGEFLGGICWCRDLQEFSDFLREEQEQLLESHETICNLMPHLVWTTTPEGFVDWYSKRWYEFTGMTKEQSIGDGFRSVIHPDDLPKLMDSWNSHRELGSECEVEVRYRRSDGIYKWMLARAVPYRDANGKILKWYGTNTDIHDLVIARIDAARNKLQMLTVLAHAEVNMFAINKDRICEMAEGGMLWDSKAQEYDVYNKSSFVGKDAIEIAQHTQPGGVPGYEKNILDVLSGAVEVAQSEDVVNGRVYRTRVVADLEQNATDGSRKPVLKGVLGLSIDVTDMKARAALEIDNARLMMEEQAAKDSNRMKSQFLANMSHELRTPTAGVIGMAELLGDDPNLNSEQREYINSIQLSAKALLTIVNDILDFSKIESGRLDIEEVPFNLASILAELCKLLSMFAQQKGLEFIYENSMDEDLEVLGDPGRTRQVLSNLLTNALKFTQEGMVKLVVSSKAVGVVIIDEDVVERIEVEFCIEDTGIGIEKDVLEKLFKPFSQGDASTARLYGGTGLGLTISKNLASLMHGSIALTSTPGYGSKALFTVPFKVSSWCRNHHLTSSSPPNPGFRYHIQPSKILPWTQPLAQRTINQDLLNQQISSSVTDFGGQGTRSRQESISLGPLERKMSFGIGSVGAGRPGMTKQRSIDAVTTPGTISMPIGPVELTPEQRSKTHVLVVEDNAINQTIAIKNIRKLGFPVTAVWNGKEALSYLLSPSRAQPRPAIILMDVQMPVMDGYEATRRLRTEKEFEVTETGIEKEMVLENVPESRRLSVTFDGELLDLKAKNKESDFSRSSSSETGLGSIIESGSSVSGERERSTGEKERRGGRRLKDIPVVAMTASAIQGDREKCHDAGMDDYLAKPVDRKSLEEMLVKWAGRSREE